MKKIISNYNFLRVAVLVLLLAAVLPQAIQNRVNAANCSITVWASPNMIGPNETSTIVYNSSSCSFLSWSGGGSHLEGSSLNVPSGSFDVGPYSQSATVTITGDGGASASATITVGSQQTTCQINTFTATPVTVNPGQTSTLSWTSSNCSGLNLVGGGMNTTVGGNGSVSTPALNSTSTFTLSSINSLSSTVNVVQPNQCAINQFGPDNNPVNYLDRSATVSWTTTNCSNVSLSIAGTQPISVANSGSRSATNIQDGDTWVLSAFSSGGNTVQSSFVFRVNTNCTITNFSYSPFHSGESTTISYTTQFCSTVQLNGGQFSNYALSGSGVGSATGSVTTNPLTQTTTYNISATGGNVAAPMSITATPTTPTGGNPPPGYCFASVTISPINSNQISGAGFSLNWNLLGVQNFTGSNNATVTAPIGNYSIVGTGSPSVLYNSVNYSSSAGANSGQCLDGQILSLPISLVTQPKLQLGN